MTFDPLPGATSDQGKALLRDLLSSLNGVAADFPRALCWVDHERIVQAAAFLSASEGAREKPDLKELRERFARERREKLLRNLPDAARQAEGVAAKLEEEARHHRVAHPFGGMSDTMFQGAGCIRRLMEYAGLAAPLSERSKS